MRLPSSPPEEGTNEEKDPGSTGVARTWKCGIWILSTAIKLWSNIWQFTLADHGCGRETDTSMLIIVAGMKSKSTHTNEMEDLDAHWG